jgi:flagellar hook assembly protein FlgD
VLFLLVVLVGLSAQDNEVYYFSPNGDGVKDQLVIPFSIKERRIIKEWHFIVTDKNGIPVRTIGEEAPKIAERPDNWREIISSVFKPKESVSVPKELVWDGRFDSGAMAPDGSYFFYISSVDDNDNYAETMRYRLVIDTVPPSVTIKEPTVAEKTFGGGDKKTMTIHQSGSREDKWSGEIKDDRGNVVRHFEWFDSEPLDIVWDGKDDKGIELAEGDYAYSISAVDAAGNKSAPAGITGIRFNTIEPSAQVGRSVSQLAPNGRTKKEIFNIETNFEKGKKEIDSWLFRIVPVDISPDTPIMNWHGKAETLPETIEWDGRLANGSIAEGNFKGVLEIKFARDAGVRAETPNFICTGLAPQPDVQISPALFSPDGDGENDILNINLDAHSLLPFESWSFVIYDPANHVPFWTQSGKTGLPQKLFWNGRGSNGELVESAMSYPYMFTVSDTQGQVSELSGSILIDVLVIRDGDKLRIRIPAIIFRANHADFISKDVDKQRGLDRATIENNERVLVRIAEILQKFRDYNVRIEGHANSETGTEKEELDQLVPLSKERADFVKRWLVSHGINTVRLSSVGMGGRQPVMKNRKDRANWWKNRRVEFILER